MKEQISNYAGWLQAGLMVVVMLMSFLGASHLYYRESAGLVLGLLLLAASWGFQRTAVSGNVFVKCFPAALAVLGAVVFFTALFAKARILLVSFDVTLALSVLYFLIMAFGSISRKEMGAKLAVSAVCVVIVVIGLVFWGKRVVVNHVVSISAEGYDNAAETAIAGKYLYIERDNGYTIRTIVYKPARVAEGDMPVIVNVHGGSWVFGWASAMDRECQNLADDLGVVVVNLDYRLLFDRPFPAQQQEVVDTVHYLYDHADEMDIDKDNIFIYGQSAGGHITAGAGIMLAEENFPLKGEILFYPFTDFSVPLEDPEWKSGSELLVGSLAGGIDLGTPVLSPASAPDEALGNQCPVFLEIGSADALEVQGEALAKRYEDAGVDITVLRLEGATHGFLAEDTDDRKEVAFQKSLEDECMAAMKEFVRMHIAQD